MYPAHPVRVAFRRLYEGASVCSYVFELCEEFCYRYTLWPLCISGEIRKSVVMSLTLLDEHHLRSI